VNWHAIARNEVRSALNERGAWALFLGFLVGFGGLAALLVLLGDPEFEGYLSVLAGGVGLLVPLAGIVLGYEAVIGARESGTAVLTLSMPHSRAGMIVGKLVGRTTLLTAVIAGAALITSIVILVFYPSFSASRYIGFMLISSIYGVVFLWVSAALSMALSTSRRVIAAAFGTYIGLTLTWNPVIDILEIILFRGRSTPSGEPETWVTFLTFVGPNTSFSYLLSQTLDIGSVPAAVADSSATFIAPTVAFLTLAAWAVLPVIAGYVSFRRSDL
jgi:ABC-2 type transport system permease protein